jgi:proteasome accessory factor B
MNRQWRLLRALSARRYGMTVREMAREMEVGEKTIRRDLKLFRRVGFSMVETTGEHGRKTWRPAGDWSTPPLEFTFEEAAALYIGRQFLEPMAGTPFWSAARGAWAKIRATLGRTALDYVDRFAGLFHCTSFGQGNYANKAEILESLTIAIEDHKATHVTYQSQRATEPATRDVYPLAMVRHKGSLYLLAGSPEPEQIRTYKVDRIEAVEVSEFVFQRYRDFDVTAYLARSFGIYDGDGDIPIAVKFLPPAARYVAEGKWHPSQSVTRLRDGSLILRLRLSNTVEIKSWILGFGASALVLEPESLRAEIAAELGQLLKAYGGVAQGAGGRGTTVGRG